MMSKEGTRSSESRHTSPATESAAFDALRLRSPAGREHTIPAIHGSIQRFVNSEANQLDARGLPRAQEHRLTPRDVSKLKRGEQSAKGWTRAEQALDPPTRLRSPAGREHTIPATIGSIKHFVNSEANRLDARGRPRAPWHLLTRQDVNNLKRRWQQSAKGWTLANSESGPSGSNQSHPPSSSEAPRPGGDASGGEQHGFSTGTGEDSRRDVLRHPAAFITWSHTGAAESRWEPQGEQQAWGPMPQDNTHTRYLEHAPQELQAWELREHQLDQQWFGTNSGKYWLDRGYQNDSIWEPRRFFLVTDEHRSQVRTYRTWLDRYRVATEREAAIERGKQSYYSLYL
jgi:hypothetical protein